MKHLKTYEENTTTPKIGDYVICTDNGVTANNKFESYLNSNIGEIIKIENVADNRDPYAIYYKNLPNEFNGYASDVDNGKKLIRFNRNEIKYFSQNKKELELIIKANIYNI